MKLWFGTFALCAVVGLSGCGSNTPTIPPELLGTGGSGAGNGDYPSGPYGTAVGAVIADLSFRGWENPVAAGFDTTRLETVSLGQFHRDPAVKILMLNTAAIWCQACKIEHRDLPERVSELSPRGFRLLSALFQDNARQPADEEDLRNWAEQFENNHYFVLDPEYSFGGFGRAEQAPLNIVVETSSMKVLRIFVGDQSTLMWPYIESELAARP